MTRYEKILAVLNEMDDCDLVRIHNDYCDSNRMYDDCIYSMDEFDEVMGGKEPWEIARCAFFGDFNPTHSWFWFNGYANLESADYVDGCPIYPENIAEYIDLEENSLGNDEIQEILDDLEETC